MEIKISHQNNSVDLIIKYTAGSLLVSNFLCLEYVEGMRSESQATEILHLLFSWKTELSVLRRPLILTKKDHDVRFLALIQQREINSGPEED